MTATAFQNLGSDPGLCQPTRAPAGRYICCCTGSYAAWPWKEPLIDWRTHTINNNTSCMPLQGTTKPSPFDWLAIMSKNQLKCTKQPLCRINIMSKQKTSSVIMSILWVGLAKTLDAFFMRRRDWIFFVLWVMREMIMSKSRPLTPTQDNIYMRFARNSYITWFSKLSFRVCFWKAFRNLPDTFPTQRFRRFPFFCKFGYRFFFF